MQHLERIEAIERRADTLNLSLWEVCRRAHLDYSRIARWRKKQNTPLVTTLDTYLSRLEAEMTAIERETLAALEASVARKAS